MTTVYKMCKVKGRGDAHTAETEEEKSKGYETHKVWATEANSLCSSKGKEITVSGRAEKSIKCPKTKK